MYYTGDVYGEGMAPLKNSLAVPRKFKHGVIL